MSDTAFGKQLPQCSIGNELVSGRQRANLFGTYCLRGEETGCPVDFMTPRRDRGECTRVFDPRFYVPRVCAGISEAQSPTDGAWSEAIRRSIDVTSDLLVADLWAHSELPLRSNLINEILPLDFCGAYARFRVQADLDR